jgi:VWFA-related protein
MSWLRRLGLAFGFCLLLFAGARQAGAQAATAKLLGPIPGSGVEEGLIKVDVVVTDKSGNPISGLSRKDFAVLDNGQPAPILSFHAFDEDSARPHPPVQVILFIDTIKLPRDLVVQEKEQVEKFLLQNGGHLSQPVSIFGISEAGLWTVKRPSGDGNLLAAEVANPGDQRLLHQAGGEGVASLRKQLDSLASIVDHPQLAALEAVSQIATWERQRPGRKLLLWIGPGCCIGSGKYLKEEGKPSQNIFDMVYWFSTLLREAHIALYSFSVGETDSFLSIYNDYLAGVKSPYQVYWMNLYKKVLAVQSGGRILPPSFEMVGQINSCIRDADAFYMLAIDPSLANQPDEYHDLKVEVSQPGLTARARTGYYDQPYYVDRPNPELKRVTVEELEQILKADLGDHDAELARRLSHLELTERMSTAKLQSWTKIFRGKKTRPALVALADASAFLDPPAGEVFPGAVPNEREQQVMISLASDYLKNTIPKLPNFYATRTTVRYEDTPRFHERDTKVDFQPLHVTDSAKVTVLYRNGKEVVDSGTNRNKPELEGRYLITHGTFGALLDWVRDAIAVPNSLTWSRWEKGPGGLNAVFRWRVPDEKSPYQVGGCCLPDGDGMLAFQKTSGYIGEIAIDAESGAILRLALKSDGKSTTPTIWSDIMVEYGSVEIGDRRYICPLRSVTLYKVRSVATVKEWDQAFRTWGPYSTLLSDATFNSYHRFRSDAQMLPGFSPVPDDK